MGENDRERERTRERKTARKRGREEEERQREREGERESESERGASGRESSAVPFLHVHASKHKVPLAVHLVDDEPQRVRSLAARAAAGHVEVRGSLRHTRGRYRSALGLRCRLCCRPCCCCCFRCCCLRCFPLGLGCLGCCHTSVCCSPALLVRVACSRERVGCISCCTICYVCRIICRIERVGCISLTSTLAISKAADVG